MSGTRLPRESLLIGLFDVCWCLGAVWVYGPPAVGVATLLRLAWIHTGWWAAALLAPVGYLLFLLGTIAMVGWLRLLLPWPRQGMSRVFRGRAFAAFLVSWGLENYFPRPLLTHIQLLTALRYLHGRALGMRLHPSTHLSPGTELHSYALIELGRFTYLGEGTGVTAHLSLGDKLLQAPVRFGDHCNVGARTNIGPGCSFGDRVKIAALVDFSPGCEIGDDVTIEPRCHFGMGVRVEDGAYIEARSFLPTYMTIPAGERWGGDPIRKLGKAPSRRRDPRGARGRPDPVEAPARGDRGDVATPPSSPATARE